MQSRSSKCVGWMRTMDSETRDGVQVVQGGQDGERWYACGEQMQKEDREMPSRTSKSHWGKGSTRSERAVTRETKVGCALLPLLSKEQCGARTRLRKTTGWDEKARKMERSG